MFSFSNDNIDTLEFYHAEMPINSKAGLLKNCFKNDAQLLHTKFYVVCRTYS